MEKINLTNDEFKNMDRFYPGIGIPNSESNLYYYEDRLFKYFNLKGIALREKIDSVVYLDSYVKNKIKELVIPQSLVYIDGDMKGVLLERIDNAKNLGTIFNDSNVSLKNKIIYLKKIGAVLDKVQKEKFEFTFCDLHPYNILVDRKNDIHIIDMDGIYLEGNQARPAYYLDVNDAIDEVPFKYPRNVFGIAYSNNNTDLLSYNLMILNVISKTRMQYKSKDEYNEYIKYLASLGYGDKLIDSFSRIYDNVDNINPFLYLDEIPLLTEDISTFKSFVKNS